MEMTKSNGHRSKVPASFKKGRVKLGMKLISTCSELPSNGTLKRLASSLEELRVCMHVCRGSLKGLVLELLLSGDLKISPELSTELPELVLTEKKPYAKGNKCTSFSSIFKRFPTTCKSTWMHA